MDNLSFTEQLFANLKTWLPYYFAVLIIGEAIYLLVKFKKIYYRETVVNLLTGGASIVIQALLKTYFFTGLYPYVYEHRLFTVGLGWQAWVLGFFVYTFLQFFTHLIYHKVRLFWCLHEVHHSAISMNVTTGLRTSVFDVVSLEMSYLLIPLLGIHPIVYFVLYILNKFWGAFIHISDRIISRIPYLEQVLVTPSIHHIHHARNIPYLDKNYGEVIPWFDKLFGTYAAKTEEPLYGTLKIQQEIGFWDAQLHEFKTLWKDVKSTPKWKHKMAYFFMPPGWHPGSKEGTTHYIQLQYKAAQKINKG
jgi:sterol desaturase/sphingolipid hydroxylase (fatty acid hydroxylase superfamily)